MRRDNPAEETANAAKASAAQDDDSQPVDANDVILACPSEDLEQLEQTARNALQQLEQETQNAIAIAKNDAHILITEAAIRRALFQDLGNHFKNHQQPGYRHLTAESFLALFEAMPRSKRWIATLHYKMQFSTHGEGGDRSPRWQTVLDLPYQDRLNLSFNLFDWLYYLLKSFQSNKTDCEISPAIIDQILEHEIRWACTYFPDQYVPSVLARAFLEIKTLRLNSSIGNEYIYRILCTEHPLLARFPTKTSCSVQLVAICFGQYKEHALTKFAKVFVNIKRNKQWSILFKDYIVMCLRNTSMPLQRKLNILRLLLKRQGSTAEALSIDGLVIDHAIKMAGRTLILDTIPLNTSTYLPHDTSEIETMLSLSHAEPFFSTNSSMQEPEPEHLNIVPWLIAWTTILLQTSYTREALAKITQAFFLHHSEIVLTTNDELNVLKMLLARNLAKFSLNPQQMHMLIEGQIILRIATDEMIKNRMQYALPALKELLCSSAPTTWFAQATATRTAPLSQAIANRLY